MEKQLATKIVATIKANIAETKKKRPTDDVHSTSIAMGTINRDDNKIEVYTGSFWKGKRLAENLTRVQAKRLATELVNQLKALKATRGWGRLSWKMEDCCYKNNGWYGSDTIAFPCEISLLAEPCKEFKSLANYLAKYCNKTITDTDIYSVGISGKRGRFYGEDGDRYYLCHNPKKCVYYLDTLRKSRGTNDKVSCTPFKEEDDADPFDMEVSRRYEQECYGTRLRFFTITITTPSGKKKAEIRIG